VYRFFVGRGQFTPPEITISGSDVAHIRKVLRLKSGDRIEVVDEDGGLYAVQLEQVEADRVRGRVIGQIPTTVPEVPAITIAQAVPKGDKMDWIVQKATELGVSAIRPVITRHTVAERVKTGRLLANATEAAEQCGILRVPEVMEPEKLANLLETWDHNRLLIFADEAAPTLSPIEALKQCKPGPLAVLIGPEGGFEREERASLLAKPFVLPISLGPRVMRADTAAVAALSLVNAVLGDWR